MHLPNVLTYFASGGSAPNYTSTAFLNSITHPHPTSLVPGDCAELWKTLMKSLSRQHTRWEYELPRRTEISLNNSIVLHARYVHNLFYRSCDNDKVKADEWLIFPHWWSSTHPFVCSRRKKDFNHDLFRSSKRIVSSTVTSCEWRRQQKRGRNATHIHACISRAIYLKRSVRYGECSRLSLRFSFYLIAVDRTRLRTYANSKRTMKVITLKFEWLIFIPAVQLPILAHGVFTRTFSRYAAVWLRRVTITTYCITLCFAKIKVLCVWRHSF